LWGRYSSWGAWRIGKKDGKEGIPEPNDTYVDYWMEVKEVAEGQIKAEMIAPFNKEKEGFAKRYNEAKTHYDTIYQEYQKAEQEEREAEENYKNHHEQQPPPAKLYNKMLFLVLASIVLMAVELPINIVAFRLFYEAEIMTWIMALSPGVVLIFAGDLLGWELKREKKRVLLIIIASVISLAVISFSVFLGMVRGEYMATIAKEEGGSASGASHLWWGFVVLNIIFFIVAVVLSWMLHDESYQALYVARKKREHFSKMKETAEKELKNAMAAYEARFRYYQTKAGELVDAAQRLMRLYKQANMIGRSRDQRANIKAFNNDLPTIDMGILGEKNPPELLQNA
jgi:hypothetical protein